MVYALGLTIAGGILRIGTVSHGADIMHDPIVLAAKIVKYIAQGRGASYDEIYKRAESKGIAVGILDNAMTLIHKRRDITRTAAGGTIMYSVKQEVVKPIGSHLVWIKDNYPWPAEPFVIPFMEEGESLDDLFMTRDEYKQKQRGGAYVAKRQYEHA